MLKNLLEKEKDMKNKYGIIDFGYLFLQLEKNFASLNSEIISDKLNETQKSILKECKINKSFSKLVYADLLLEDGNGVRKTIKGLLDVYNGDLSFFTFDFTDETGFYVHLKYNELEDIYYVQY